MASNGQDLYLNARQYLQWHNIPPNRFTDEILAEWFYIMRELWTKKGSLEILYDLTQER